ncbi:MAG: gamma-glutamyl-gamma-aminobutyrate hydrolase family protein [Chloroflexi bacterium]|nr:gamma-glutamyl-gamma-aminobutyrate hydrolase family protein [Chloroflexota bacterium]
MQTPTIGIARPRNMERLPDYETSIRRAGGNVVVVDVHRDELATAFNALDGLLLTGGADVDPELYGERQQRTVHPAKRRRDLFEIAIARLAVERDVPLFAICRGAQVLNVALGGNLVQDIPTEIESALPHKIEEPLAEFAHEVNVADGSLLRRSMNDMLSNRGCRVNSRHRQAVKRLGRDLVVSARAPDGVIEAIEHTGARFCLGVQWHPENFWHTGEFHLLFEAFVAACQERPTRRLIQRPTVN